MKKIATEGEGGLRDGRYRRAVGNERREVRAKWKPARKEGIDRASGASWIREGVQGNLECSNSW